MLHENPPEGMTVMLANESDLMNWLIIVEGPAGTPYKVSS